MTEIDPGKEVCSFLEKKLTLFRRYLHTTKRMKEALKDKEAGNPGDFISERQNCINKIGKIDSSIENIINTSADRLNHISGKFSKLIHGYLSSITSIMETVDLIDRELMIMVKEQGEGTKREILRMRNVQQAARGYKKEKRYNPRFLDTVR